MALIVRDELLAQCASFGKSVEDAVLETGRRLTDDELQTACQPLIEWVEAKTEERIMKEIDEVEGAMRDAKEKEERRDIRKRKIARISEKVNVTMTTDDDRPKRKFEMAASDLPVIADGEIVLSIDKRPPLKSPGSPKGDEEDSLDSDDDDYAAMAKICIPPKDYSAFDSFGRGISALVGCIKEVEEEIHSIEQLISMVEAVKASKLLRYNYASLSEILDFLEISRDIVERCYQ